MPTSSGVYRYNKVAVLGAGSFGKVYKVKGKEDGEMYVLKRIALVDQKDLDNAKLSAFKEVEVLQALHHPHIVRIMEHFWDEEEQDLCVVMTYCEGGDMYNMIRKKWEEDDKVKEADVWSYLVQLLSALCYLHHELNTLHRDLKTQNVFLTNNSTHAMIGDFGLAKMLDHTVAMANTQLGTPFYMAPEIMQGQDYNHKSDMWALGCIGYELCAGNAAFSGATFTEVSNRVQFGTYDPIPSCYSPELRQVIHQLLRKSAHERPSARDLLYSAPFSDARARYTATAPNGVKLWQPKCDPPPYEPSLCLDRLPSATSKKKALPSLTEGDSPKALPALASSSGRGLIQQQVSLGEISPPQPILQVQFPCSSDAYDPSRRESPLRKRGHDLEMSHDPNFQNDDNCYANDKFEEDGEGEEQEYVDDFE